MKIESRGEETVVVELTAEDMREMDITYEALDYRSVETRRVIWTILDRVKRSLGRSPETDGRLLIEAAPSEDGGCVLCFSGAPADGKVKKRMILKKEDEPLVFQALDADAFLTARELLKENVDRLRRWETYRLNGAYYAVLYPQPACAQVLAFRLGEFGDASFRPPIETGRLLENGEPLGASAK